MTAAERAAQMRRRAEREQPAAEEVAAQAERPARPAKVRQTVDLTRERHEEFARWRLTTALALDQTRLTTQDALAALVDVLLDDEQVQRRVHRRLEIRG